MKKIRIFLFLLLVTLILNNCGGFQEAMDPQRKNKTDEFLVEKKSPLVMPPDFNELPLPKTSENNQENVSGNNIEKLISNNNSPESSGVQDKNFENLIIEKIKQN